MSTHQALIGSLIIQGVPEETAERIADQYLDMHGEQVAQKIEELIARFVGETWAHENRKRDVLMGMRLGARIARGELAQDVESP